MLDINSHNTNAGYGSNRNTLGANIFQPIHDIVQPRIIKKKPIVPTLFVIQIANRSILLKLSCCATFGLNTGFPNFLNSLSDLISFAIKLISVNFVAIKQLSKDYQQTYSGMILHQLYKKQIRKALTSQVFLAS
jgi:hypothetical protein